MSDPLEPCPLPRAAWARRGAIRLAVHPAYRSCLESMGLRDVEDFLGATGPVMAQHRRSDVIRLEGELEGQPVGLYLKRHPTGGGRHDQLVSCLRRGRPVSAARIEWENLISLAAIGVGAPLPVALGEELSLLAERWSFLVTRELAGQVSLFRAAGTHREPAWRHGVSRKVAALVARLHRRGFDHPDLYSWHVYVSEDGQTLSVLDVARTRRHLRVRPWRRARDLVALDLSLSPESVSGRERARFLLQYLSAAFPSRSRRRRRRDRRRLLELMERRRRRIQGRKRFLLLADREELDG